MAGLNGRTATEVLEMFDQRVRRLFTLAHRDICPNCTSQMTTAVRRLDDPGPELPLVFKHVCEHCALEIYSPPGAPLLERPEVVSFYYRHDVDLFSVPYWEIEWMFDTECIDIRSSDPLEFVIHVTVADQQLDVTLNEYGTVAVRDR